MCVLTYYGGTLSVILVSDGETYFTFVTSGKKKNIKKQQQQQIKF